MIKNLLLAPLILGLTGSSAFANEAASNTFNGIVQDDITFYHGCGAGCHSRHFQLTDPESTKEYLGCVVSLSDSSVIYRKCISKCRRVEVSHKIKSKLLLS